MGSNGNEGIAAIVQLSVILPNFQHGHVISRALGALLSQDRKPDEIVVVDDASTDDSVAVIEQAAARSREIRLLANATNCGAIASLKRGLDDARGSYVYFAAADDWVLPRFFAQAVETLEANPQAGLFCGDAMLVDATSNRTLGVRPPVMPLSRAGFVDPAATGRLLARSDNWILTGSAVFRRAAIADAGGLDEGLGSFADGFLARKISLMRGFCYAPQVVAAWCVHPSGLSRSAALDAKRAGRVLELVTAKIAADAVFPPWYVQLFADRWRFATARLALQATPRNDVVIMAMGARSKLDRVVLSLASRLPGRSLANLAMLGWLWLRFRPYRLADLLRTAAFRRFVSARDFFRLPARMRHRT
jgi:glycosyltransferase involved in cell wall biosynthesis